MSVDQLRHDAGFETGGTPAQAERRQAWLAVGGMLGAFASMSCCIVSLVLFSLGLGGAWIGTLTALAPYQPIFVAISLGFLGTGFWLVYLRPKRACMAGEACARHLPGRIVRTSLWLATAMVVAALAFPYLAPALLGT
jgi:mercuric ion transport protein